MNRIWFSIGIVVLLFVAVIFHGPVFAIGRPLLAGWVQGVHGEDFRVDLGATEIAVGAILLPILFGLLHFSVRWRYRRSFAKRGEHPPEWRIRWTLTLFLTFFLFLAAGYAVVELSRQAYKVYSSREPVINVKEYRYGSIETL